jgi:hypothetical protein
VASVELAPFVRTRTAQQIPLCSNGADASTDFMMIDVPYTPPRDKPTDRKQPGQDQNPDVEHDPRPDRAPQPGREPRVDPEEESNEHAPVTDEPPSLSRTLH